LEEGDGLLVVYFATLNLQLSVKDLSSFLPKQDSTLAPIPSSNRLQPIIDFALARPE